MNIFCHQIIFFSRVTYIYNVNNIFNCALCHYINLIFCFLHNLKQRGEKLTMTLHDVKKFLVTLNNTTKNVFFYIFPFSIQYLIASTQTRREHEMGKIYLCRCERVSFVLPCIVFTDKNCCFS